MNLRPTYRASMYVMLTLATLVLNINATDYNRYAMLFPLGVAIAGVAAFLGVDRNPRFGLDRNLGQFLALVSFLVAMAEYWADNSALLVALGHWLVYLQLVKMFLPKSVEDDWFLFLLGLVQVVIGGYIGQSPEIGLAILGWALTGMWSLGLFFLDREARGYQVEPGVAVVPGFDGANPYPGLINVGFVLSALLVAITTLALGGLIFLAMPRWNSSSNAKGGVGPQSHLTGFSEEVRLGQMGEILENDEVVMTVELYDGQNNSLHPSEELHWRGVTLGRYENGRWFRFDTVAVNVDRQVFPALDSAEEIRQHVRLESTDSDVVFSLRPIYNAFLRGQAHLAFNILDGTLYRSDSTGVPFSESSDGRPRSLEYAVISSKNENGLQPNEHFPVANQRRQLLSVPQSIRAQIDEIAQEALGPEQSASPLAKARALERYFLDSGKFFYTLRMRRVDRDIDPVLDFLVNRKEGHCEYFASGLTLMLRSQGIPARLVNGFKGGDWNPLVRVITVRQKHAHSWVEALVGRNDNGDPVWLTLDPTPAQERDEVVAQVSHLPASLRTLADAFRHGWTSWIVGFNQDRQARLLYQPAMDLAREALFGFRIIYKAMRTAFGWLFAFEKVGDFFSFRGFVVSFCTMLLAVGVFRGLYWLLKRILARFRTASVEDGSFSSSVAFYHRFLRLLNESGLRRPDSETPREFARRAMVHLSGLLDGQDGLAEVSSQVVDAFYLVRFGHRELDPSTLKRLENRLNDLELGLKTPRN